MKDLIHSNLADEAENKFTMNDKPKEKKTSKKHNMRLNKPLFVVNLKIDNTQRNFLNVLIGMGVAKTQKEAFSFLIKKYYDSASDKDKAKMTRAVNNFNRFDKMKYDNKKGLKDN